jgi:hypothetical protein
MTQKAFSKTELAKLIKVEYDFNDYAITPDKLISIVETFNGIIERFGINEKIIKDFFVDLHFGKLGTMYKAPSDIVSKFYNYCDKKRSKLSI